MTGLDFFANTSALSNQLSRKRGSPLNFFLSPYIERYLKQLEQQLGIPEGPLEGNPMAKAIRGGMESGSDMESPIY